MACQDHATALAASLKDLTNHGAQLVHAGIPVENILVLNAGEFDVRDLLPGALQLVDSVSGQRILVLSTYANKERMRVLGDDVCRGVQAISDKIAEKVHQYGAIIRFSIREYVILLLNTRTRPSVSHQRISWNVHTHHVYHICLAG